MSYNTYPQNPFPSNSELLQKLDSVAKAIDDMPTFTSNDKAFLNELPAFPSTDGVKVLTATTESGETSLSYEEIENELPAEPSADGVKVLTATTESGETVLSWETPESGLINYSTTEQATGRKWIDNKDTYQIVISLDSSLAVPSNTWTDTGITFNVDTIVNAFAINNSGVFFSIFASPAQGKLGILQTRNAQIDVDTIVIEYTKATT